MPPTLRQHVIAVLERQTGIVGAYLFGSRAKGEETPASDADLAVLGRQPLPLDSLVALQDELEASLGIRFDVIQSL